MSDPDLIAAAERWLSDEISWEGRRMRMDEIRRRARLRDQTKRVRVEVLGAEEE